MKTKSYKRLRIYLTAIYSFCCLYLYAQDINETYLLAEGQYNIRNYDLAIQLYQRILCFGNKEQQNKCYLNLANCYFIQTDYSKAYEYYDLSIIANTEDSMKQERTFNKIQTLLLDKNYNLALEELIDTDGIKSSYFIHKRNLYLGIIYFLLNDFKNSKRSFEKLLQECCPDKSPEFDKLVLNIKKLKKIKAAKILNTLIPGMGQIYTGDIKNVLNSSFLNVTMLSLTIVVGVNYGILDAMVSAVPWIFRYYTNGIIKAENIALYKMAKQKSDIYLTLLQLFANCTNCKIK